jgi:hypothetical protein
MCGNLFFLCRILPTLCARCGQTDEKATRATESIGERSPCSKAEPNAQGKAGQERNTTGHPERTTNHHEQPSPPKSLVQAKAKPKQRPPETPKWPRKQHNGVTVCRTANAGKVDGKTTARRPRHTGGPRPRGKATPSQGRAQGKA